MIPSLILTLLYLIEILKILEVRVRIQYYDNLRALAVFLVILTHSAMPALESSFGVSMVFFSLIASPSSELFVSISSGLLAPTKMPMFQFYRKRFSKLLFPFLFWSVFMVAYRYLIGQIDGETAVYKILLFPIEPTEGAYWFVYAICGLYLINPVISPWLEVVKKREFHFILGLWLITLVLPYLNIITGEQIYDIQGDYYFILTYLGGFIGFMLIGVYFKRYPIFFKDKFKAFSIVLTLIALGTIPILGCYLFNKPALTPLSNNLSLTSAFYVSSIYIFFKNFKFSMLLERCASIIAKHSFGIYLIHIFIVREVVWKFLENSRLPHPLIETPFIALVSLMICLMIVKCLSYLPKSKYFIGV